MKLANRIALITAAGSGMGRAAALRFATEGAHVVVTDVSKDAAGAVADEIVGSGGSAEAHALDVADRSAVDGVFDAVGTRHGRLHVLYNHAGIPGASGLDIDDQAWQLATDVNLKGAFMATAAALPWLRRAEQGASIIFTASVSGLVGSPLSPLYSMTKGGVVLLMKSLALKLGPDGIRVNAICPGPIATPMLPQFFGREAGEGVDDLVEQFVANVPLGRHGRPEEIAAAALFLASDDASFVTGVALPVDGGYLAR
jgi:NAD(P)-dependent dehydrogenase (short-subunit alcohol dehydrogenase family)